MPSKMHRELVWLIPLAAATLGSAGCGTVKQSGTVRTGTEQILLTNAWDDALQKVDFRPLTGVPVYLDTQNLNSTIDQGWITSSLRQAMLTQGVLIRSKPEQARWVVEARVGAYGTDSYDWLVGVRQMTMPVTVPGLPTGTIPEIPVIKKTDQRAYAKLALFAYDRSSGQLVWRSGTQLAMANAKDAYFAGVGPVQSGTIWQKNKRVGINLPIIDDPMPAVGPAVVPNTAGSARGSSTSTDLPGAALNISPGTSDRDAFGPGG
jgi:hypothetical protein